MYPGGDLHHIKHKDHVTFTCKPGTKADRNSEFRQQCHDGGMDFPVCHKYNY